MNIPVYVLAGGQSRRFPPDKLQLRVDGQLLPEVAASPFGLGRRTLVVDRADRLPLAWRMLVEDTPHQGPAHALLQVLQNAEPGWFWLVAGDMPEIPESWVGQLTAALMSGDMAVAWRQGEFWQPLPSLWHTDALQVVGEVLRRGDGALHTLLEAVHARAVALPGLWTATVPRLNTPADWAAWQRDRAQVGRRPRIRMSGMSVETDVDVLAVERPLQVDVVRGERTWPLGVTLRTPGDDTHLALGLAVAEGLIRRKDDVAACRVQGDVVQILLSDQAPEPPQTQDRVRPAMASCGACGKAEIDLSPAGFIPMTDAPPVSPQLLGELPDRLRAQQRGFAQTGAMHAAGLFDAAGTLRHIAEDVGRHNALDKLIGHALLADALPLTGQVLVLSGRVAFELVQKAARAGIGLIVAVGAPSTLAVDVAEAAGITLVGFARPGRCNVYTHAGRVHHRPTA